MIDSASDGKSNFAVVKRSAESDGSLLTLGIEGTAALLRPVATRQSAQDSGDVKRLTEWRNRFRTAFLTEFIATTARTSAWLDSVVQHDDTRILFMVDDAGGVTIGYMGLAFIDWKQGYGEADAIVRGVDASPGLMRDALRTLLAWAHKQLGLHHIGVRVRSDNKAIGFYRSLGFKETRRVPLVATVESDGAVIWRECVADHVSDLFLVYNVLVMPTT